MVLRSILLAVSLAALPLAGCGDDADAPRVAAGAELLVGWSEASEDRDVLEAVGRPDRTLRTQEELDELLEAATPELDVSVLRDVDMDEVVLVVGSYPRCDESSVVEVEDGEPHLVVVEPEDGVECAWAPLQVDVWSVARSALDER